jgi:conjugative transfer signal peptidase TraF
MVCLPEALGGLGRRRGYLPGGNCAGGTSAVLKRVVALAGDAVDLQESSFAVNGRVLDRSALHDVDSLGRPLEHVPLGRQRVSDGEAWVLGVHRERSWDSRYFGPIPIESIMGRVEPLLVFRQAQD